MPKAIGSAGGVSFVCEWGQRPLRRAGEHSGSMEWSEDAVFQVQRHRGKKENQMKMKTSLVVGVFSLALFMAGCQAAPAPVAGPAGPQGATGATGDPGQD